MYKGTPKEAYIKQNNFPRNVFGWVYPHPKKVEIKFWKFDLCSLFVIRMASQQAHINQINIPIHLQLLYYITKRHHFLLLRIIVKTQK